MARREFDLKTILDIPLWETVQDQIAKLTGTAIITIDFKGNPVTKHSCLLQRYPRKPRLP